MKESKSKYKVSIITVVYNSVGTVEQTIQSVLNQSYRDIEYIVIDGLSTDGTQDIVKKYRDAIAFFVSEKDHGIYDAMNKGIQKATGDIVGIINSDDWYAENAIEKIVDYFMQNEADVVYGKVVDIYQDGRESLIGEKKLSNMWFQNTLHHPSVFVKRNIYEGMGAFDTKYKISADYDLLLRFYSKGAKFGYIDDVIAYFRIGGISSTRKRQVEEENYAISKSYLNECPNKVEVASKIEEVRQWARFEREISDRRELLSEMLCKFFGKKIKNITVFGTGVWGEICYECLRNERVAVQCFADNNMDLWGKKIHNISVISPYELQNTDRYVLIAVKDYGDEIKLQLKGDDSTKWRCVTIKDLKLLFYEQFI